MTEKELKKLSRKQLLELLLRQTERADFLEEKLIRCERELSDKNIKETEAGSIAEAALRLNGIFEAADAAAAQYLENVRRQAGGEDVNIYTPDAKEMLDKVERECKEREARSEERLKELADEIQRLYRLKRKLQATVGEDEK